MRKSLTYQLGQYIGEYILSKYLPTISCEPPLTNVVKQVSTEEAKQYQHLQEDWFNEPADGQKRSDKFKAYRKYVHTLQIKYLPHELKCSIHELHNIRNMDQLKNGIIEVLWNSDICCYRLEPDDIIIKTHDVMGSTIILKLETYETT